MTLRTCCSKSVLLKETARPPFWEQSHIVQSMALHHQHRISSLVCNCVSSLLHHFNRPRHQSHVFHTIGRPWVNAHKVLVRETCNCTSWCITSPKDLFACGSSLACFASTLVVTKRREHHAHSTSLELGLHHFYAWSSWRPTTTMHARFVLVPLDWIRTSHTKMVAPTFQQWKTYSEAKLRSKQDGFQTQLHIESWLSSV